jgi:hypothetical protein
MGFKFIIFGQARSGTTTLLEVLNLHPQVNAITEPFNLGRSGWGHQYVNDNHSIEQVSRALEQLAKEVNAFKHLVEQGNEITNAAILDTADFVITLRRMNHMQTTLSNFICQQTNHWRTNKSIVENHIFKPVDIDKFKAALIAQKTKFQYYDEYLITAGIPHRHLLYENFYQKSAKNKYQTITSLFRDIGLRNIKEQDIITKVNQKLDPANSKLNSYDIYKKIPNIETLDKLFSCKEYGFIFS